MRIKENVRETHDNSPISHSLAHRHTANPIFMGCKSFCGLVRLLIAFKSYSLWSAQIRKRLPKMKSEAVIIKISNSIGNWRWYANAKCEMKMYARYDFVPFRLTLHLIFLHSKGYRVESHCTNAYTYRIVNVSRRVKILLYHHRAAKSYVNSSGRNTKRLI